MSFLEYLFAAYACIWVAIFLYVRRIAKQGAELEEEIRELRQRLGR